MRLAGEQEHDGTLRIADDLAQPVEIVEQQRRALVLREAPPEADRQHVGVVGIGPLEQPVEVRFAAVVAEMLDPHAMADEMEQLRLQLLPHAPEQVVGDRIETLAQARAEVARRRGELHVAVEEQPHLRREERRRVHAVRDPRHRVLLARDLRPQVLQHPLGDLAMDAAHAVVEARAAHGERRHVEFAAAGGTAERQQFVVARARVAQETREVPPQRVGIEAVLPRGNRRVRREHRARRDRLERRGDADPIL